MTRNLPRSNSLTHISYHNLRTDRGIKENYPKYKFWNQTHHTASRCQRHFKLDFTSFHLRQFHVRTWTAASGNKRRNINSTDKVNKKNFQGMFKYYVDQFSRWRRPYNFYILSAIVSMLHLNVRSSHNYFLLFKDNLNESQVFIGQFSAQDGNESVRTFSPQLATYSLPINSISIFLVCI